MFNGYTADVGADESGTAALESSVDAITHPLSSVHAVSAVVVAVAVQTKNESLSQWRGGKGKRQVESQIVVD